MSLIPPTDALYLWIESATSPAHVIAMQLFKPPADAPDDLLEGLFAEMTDVTRLKPEFRRRPYRSPRTASAEPGPLIRRGRGGPTPERARAAGRSR
jgi:diacylglycerol O-acyltransferase